MGAAAVRTQLAANINRAFSVGNIANSAQQVRSQKPRGDFLDICDALGFMQPVHRGDLPRYRRTLNLPTVVRRTLTAVFRESLFHRPAPIPLNIAINHADEHSIHVTHTDKQISVVLNRPDPAPRGSA